jgi:hypothetical protein
MLHPDADTDLQENNKHYIHCVGFEVLTAVVMKSTICWDITPCSPLKSQAFQRHTSPPSSGSKNEASKKPVRKQNSACRLLSHWCFAWLILRPWIWRQHVPAKRRLTLNGLHGVINQKKALSIIYTYLMTLYKHWPMTMMKMETLISVVRTPG